MHPINFNDLSSKEKYEYRAWARTNFDVQNEIKVFWHPIVQLECAKMKVEVWRKSQEECSHGTYVLSTKEK